MSVYSNAALKTQKAVNAATSMMQRRTRRTAVGPQLAPSTPAARAPNMFYTSGSMSPTFAMPTIAIAGYGGQYLPSARAAAGAAPTKEPNAEELRAAMQDIKDLASSALGDEPPAPRRLSLQGVWPEPMMAAPMEPLTQQHGQEVLHNLPGPVEMYLDRSAAAIPPIPDRKRMDQLNQAHERARIRRKRQLKLQRTQFRTMFDVPEIITNACKRLLSSVWFDRLILFVIACNCVVLSFPDQEETGEYRDTFVALDATFTVLYTVEMIIKLIATGVVGEPNSYFRIGWNWLDFIIVIEGLVSFATTTSGLQSFRVIRALRPLRGLHRLPGLQSLVNTLLRSMPMLGSTLVVCGFYFIVMGTVGLQLFQGSFKQRCYYLETGLPVTSDLRNCGGIHDCDVGQYCGKDPNNPDDLVANFDNLGWATVALFQCVTMEGWSELMYRTQDAVSGASWIYFLVVIACGAFIIVNLTLAVIMAKFHESATHEHHERLQEQRLTMKRAALVAARLAKISSAAKIRTLGDTESPSTLLQPALVTASSSFYFPGAPKNVNGSSKGAASPGKTVPGNPWVEDFYRVVGVLQAVFGPPWARLSGVCWQIAEYPALTAFILLCVAANTVALTIDHAGISDAASDALNTINLVFTIIFVVEQTIKVIGYGRSYSDDRMNVFDLVITIISLVEAFMNGTASLSVFRVVRVVRILRLLRHMKSMQLIVNVLSRTLPSFGFMFLLLSLFTFVYALVGLQLFGSVYVDTPLELTPRATFRSVGWSMLTVFQVLSGEGWNDIMTQYVRLTSAWAALYFVSWVVLGQFVLLNLLLAVLLDGFNGLSEEFLVKDDDPDDEHGHLDWEAHPQTPSKSIRQMKLFKSERHSIAFPAKPKMSGEAKTMPVEPKKLPAASFRALASHRELPRRTSSQSERSSHASDGSSDQDEEFYDVRTANSDDDPTDDFYDAREEQGVSGLSGSARHGMSSKLDPREEPAVGISAPVASKADVPRSASRAELHQRLTPLNLQSLAGTSKPGAGQESPATSVRSMASRPKSTSNVKSPLHEAFAKVQEPVVGVLGRLWTRIAAVFGEVPDLDGTSPWQNRHMYCVPRGSWLQTACERLCNPKQPLFTVPLWWFHWKVYFDTLVMVLIIISSIELALDSPTLPPDDPLEATLNVVEIVMTTLFVIEISIKCIAYGVLFHKNAYLRSGYNIIDAVVVLASVITLLVPDAGLTFFRVLRIVRSLRPLRLINRNQGIRVVVNALIGSVGGLVNVSALLLVLWLMFAIVGVALFKGELITCANPVDFPANTPMSGIVSPTNTSQYLVAPCAEVVSAPLNFDNVISAMLVLFAAATGEAWPAVMYMTIDATQEGWSPSRDFNPAASLYFVIFVCIGVFFFLNLFIGVVFERFVVLSRTVDGFGLLTESQRNWVEAQRTLRRVHAYVQGIPPVQEWRRVLYRISNSGFFDAMIMVFVLFSVASQAASYDDEPQSWTDFLEGWNIAITLIFTLEAIMKILGLGWWQYIRMGWNQFDLIVVIGSIIDTLFSFLSTSTFRVLRFGRVLSRVFRILRISRGFRLARNMQSFQRILTTLYISIPSLLNVGSLLALLFFVYAVIGMYLYGTLDASSMDNIISPQANFATFPDAMSMLFRTATGEGWQDVMAYVALRTPGGMVVAGIYFVSFLATAQFVTFNLFIMIILEDFAGVDDTDAKFSVDDIEAFKEVWAKFDPAGTGFMRSDYVEALLRNLPPPMGLPRSASYLEFMQRCQKLGIMSWGGYVQFNEMLLAVHRVTFGSSIPQPVLYNTLASPDKIRRRIGRTIKRTRQNPIVRLISEFDESGPQAESTDMRYVLASIRIQRYMRYWLYHARYMMRQRETVGNGQPEGPAPVMLMMDPAVTTGATPRPIRHK